MHCTHVYTGRAMSSRWTLEPTPKSPVNNLGSLQQLPIENLKTVNLDAFLGFKVFRILAVVARQWHKFRHGLSVSLCKISD